VSFQDPQRLTSAGTATYPGSLLAEVMFSRQVLARFLKAHPGIYTMQASHCCQLPIYVLFQPTDNI